MKDMPNIVASVIALLGVAIVVLKLCSVIAWSWWIVTSPFSLLLVILILSLAAMIGPDDRSA